MAILIPIGSRQAVRPLGRQILLAVAAMLGVLVPPTALNSLAAAEEPQRQYVVTRQGKKPRPTVAVDNVCAWPNLTQLRDGTIAAVIFNKPCHACMVGDVECWASADQGETWEKRGLPAAHDLPESNRMNVAAGLVRILEPWVCRSGDGGFPSSVQLPDGKVLTAYYASGIEGHPRYHMGVVVWDP